MGISLYLRKYIVYIPTMRRVPNSYQISGEPVELVPVSDLVAIAEALERALRTGNPPISGEDARKQPSWVTKERTGVGSWAAFERGTLTWSVGSSIKTNEFQMRAYIADKKQGGWTPAPDPLFTLPRDTPLADVARRAAAVVHEAAGLRVEP